MPKILDSLTFIGKQSRRTGSAEAGLTLIECLVAIVVIAIATATIAPMMVFAVATRVQNQKTEQALQIAQGELDKVRLVVEQGGDYGDRLTDIGLIAVATSTASTITTVNAPTRFVASVPDVTNATDARVIDTDGDGDNDFAIQLFRNTGIEVASQTPGVTASTPVVFNVGTRVYDIRSEPNASTGNLLTSEARLTFTSGNGDRSLSPLAVLYGQIAQGDRDGSLCQYWEFAGSTPTTLQCN
ncbi:MAG: prepilin-type N-terminal cleavage/methylation domain-containing protein [Cyanobacteria bacterium J06632_3]